MVRYRYLCSCIHYIEDISDLLVIYAKDVAEAVEKARKMFCNGEHECMENTSCYCELEEE